MREIIPKIAWITVNRKCNMRCKWCYASGTDYKGEMSFEMSKKLAILISECGIKKIILIGGEPTIWTHLTTFNKFCRKLGIKTILATNALAFSNDKFWVKYKTNPNDSVGISLKGCSEKSYKETAGIEGFSSVISGLKRGVSLFNSGVGTVYSKTDSETLIDTARFAKQIGATYLNIGFCTPTISKNDSNGVFMTHPKEIVADIVTTYDEISRIMQGKISFSMKLPLCIWPKDFIKILISKKQISTLCQLRQRVGLIFDVSGEVILCNTLYDFPVGKFEKDFSNSKDLIEFFNSPKITGYYEKLNSYPSQKCISCSEYTKCAGGCPILWSVYKPDEIITGM